jgi:hypothetical protein
MPRISRFWKNEAKTATRPSSGAVEKTNPYTGRSRRDAKYSIEKELNRFDSVGAEGARSAG